MSVFKFTILSISAFVFKDSEIIILGAITVSAISLVIEPLVSNPSLPFFNYIIYFTLID